jgi:hypothetical protein
MKQHKIKYLKELILSSVYDFESDNRIERIKFLKQRFEAEKGWQIDREGFYPAAKDWFQGLALNTPYNNWDIVALVYTDPKELTEGQFFKLVESYWNRLPLALVELFAEVV